MPEQIHRQASTSPVRTGVAAGGMGPTPSPASPSSSNASVRKKAVSVCLTVFFWRFVSFCRLLTSSFAAAEAEWTKA